MKKLFLIMELHKNMKEAILVLLLTIFMTLIETVGISLMMPFVQIAIDFEEIHKHEYYELVYTFLNFTTEKKFVLMFGAFLLFFFVFRTLYIILYGYIVSSYSKKLYRQIIQDLYTSYLGLSYRDFIDKNSSRMTQILTQEGQSSEAFIRVLITTFGDLLTIIVVYTLLLYLDWKITLIFTTILGLNVLILSKTVTPVIKRKGVERTEVFRDVYKTLNETFGNFKMIKLRSSEQQIASSFSRLMYKLTRLMIVNETFQRLPRLFLELTGFALIISIILYWIVEYDSDISNFMGILSVFFFAMYRLMPVVNRVVSSFNNITFLRKSLEIIADSILDKQEKFGSKQIALTNSIEIKNLSFEYVKNKSVLKDISLKIQKGANVAFIGPSGSGKSTIIDLIIGLYAPTSGSIDIGGDNLNYSNMRSWRQQVGYIPQDIYLFDATVAENVSLESLEELDEDRVIQVLKKAHVYDFLIEHQEGIHTFVGEKGVKLSGGQKQRIAIARALYHDPEVLVLDEATSALDTATESEIMKNIYEAGEGKTLLIIAHRLSTIEDCDTVYTLENGLITNVKSRESSR